MDLNTATQIDDVKAVVVDTLGLESRADMIGASTPLLGALPELDSMAVLELVFALEQRFGVSLEADDITAESFETLGTLAEVVERRLG